MNEPVVGVVASPSRSPVVDVSPFLEQDSVEPLDLAVGLGLGPVGGVRLRVTSVRARAEAEAGDRSQADLKPQADVARACPCRRRCTRRRKGRLPGWSHAQSVPQKRRTDAACADSSTGPAPSGEDRGSAVG